MLVEDLQLAFARDKTSVVASLEALTTSVALDLDAPISGIVGSARNLGIDVSSALRSQIAAAASQFLDGAHLQVLNWLTQRRRKVFVARVAPSVMFGVGVAGIAPAHFRQVLSRAAKAFGFGGPFCSVDSGMVLHGRLDPAVEAVTGHLRQHAGEWWRETDPSTTPGAHFSPGFLVGAFC